ncbi:hypothetical protein QWJ34_05665 [Saccharibacillus sp. CPCC 101409]|uniref:hypothetical protein n=1 Tax=Saccharibacillus sp. CPCC 101409 TaxID=3058041 RepID=UPI002670F0FE|nr:hypothetical protein [Saccharibacillus sp. CPCC 101409]MDO3409242.1 hypothetical protein [Saccharibacillus sp. CPCC 101409]
MRCLHRIGMRESACGVRSLIGRSAADSARNNAAPPAYGVGGWFWCALLWT